MKLDEKKLSELKNDIEITLNQDGFEIHPFKHPGKTLYRYLHKFIRSSPWNTENNMDLPKTPIKVPKTPKYIKWYNELVKKPFEFPYSDDTIAFLVVSTPDMFEKAFKSFLVRQECTEVQDPIDQCVAFYFDEVKKAYKDHEIEALHDFEMDHNRRPKVLVQTAAHVSGAAYYYQRSDVTDDPWGDKKNIYGVSIHPKYGGWFAMRGVLIFKDIECPTLEKKSPVDCVSSREDRIKLLERFNYHWQDWTYRDIIEVESKYSEEQKDYFATLPSQRKAIVDSIRKRHLEKCS